MDPRMMKKRISQQIETKKQRGFSMLEVVISIVVLTIGLVGLLSVFGVALAATQTSEQDLIAKQLANEAIESIETARNTGQIKFNQIQNVSSGGIFVDGAQPVKQPGADGILGTADDGPAEVFTRPGPGGLITGTTPPDVTIPLTNYTRTIAIAPAVVGGVTEANLNSITVTITYTVPSFPAPKTYVSNSFISQFR